MQSSHTIQKLTYCQRYVNKQWFKDTTSQYLRHSFDSLNCVSSNKQPKNNSFLRKKNTKGLILKQKGTRMEKIEADWKWRFWKVLPIFSKYTNDGVAFFNNIMFVFSVFRMENWQLTSSWWVTRCSLEVWWRSLVNLSTMSFDALSEDIIQSNINRSGQETIDEKKNKIRKASTIASQLSKSFMRVCKFSKDLFVIAQVWGSVHSWCPGIWR